MVEGRRAASVAASPGPGFNRLKQWQGIATRYDKTAQAYQAAVTVASLLTWA